MFVNESDMFLIVVIIVGMLIWFNVSGIVLILVRFLYRSVLFFMIGKLFVGLILLRFSIVDLFVINVINLLFIVYFVFNFGCVVISLEIIVILGVYVLFKLVLLVIVRFEWMFKIFVWVVCNFKILFCFIINICFFFLK